MTDRRPRAVVYAEDTLGIHGLFADVKAYGDQYEAAQMDIPKVYGDLQKARQKLSDFEVTLMDLARTEVLKESEKPSEAATERKYKQLRAESTKWQDLREKILLLSEEHDNLHAEMEVARTKVRSTQAQMNVVGNYLGFLAAHRVAATEAVKHANLPY